MLFRSWFPHLLQDSILSVAVAHPASLSLLASLEFLIYFGICVIGFAPFIIVSGAGGFLAVAHSTKKDLYELGILLSMWMIPLIGVIAQSDFYYYEYLPLTVAGIITSLWLLKRVKRPDIWILVILAATAGLWGALAASWSPTMHSGSWIFWNEKARVVGQIKDRKSVV